MQINYNGILFRIAYGKLSFLTAPKKQVSLCKFFWSVIAGALSSIFLSAILAIIAVLVSVIGFFFAFRPDWRNENQSGISMSYTHWPRIRGHRIYPLFIILPGWLLYAFWFVLAELQWSILPWHVQKEMSYLISPDLVVGLSGASVFLLGWLFIIVACFAIIVGIVLGISYLLKTEWGIIVREYIKAKKARACPLIKIVGAPPE